MSTETLPRLPHARATDAVGHTLATYLPRSCTFIYTTLRFQSAFRPVVLAEQTQNLSEFPIEPVHRLAPTGTKLHRAVRRLGAHAHGFRRAYDHRLVKAAEQTGCVLLHAHFGWSGCAAVTASDRLGIPLVTTFYGRDLSDPRGLDYERLFADGRVFIAEGPTMRAQLAQLGCPFAKTRLLRIGLDTTRFQFAPKQRSSPLIVVQACRFVEKKGIDLSIRTFAKARPRLGPSELWLVGDGELRSELEALAATLRLSDSVRFLGMLSADDYRRVIRQAHVCIQPSRVARDGDTEGGAPTVLLEMQAVGIPVVSTRHADIPFVVAAPERLSAEGDVDALAEELVRISDSSSQERFELAERGRSFVESRHDARVVATELAEIYREALAVSNGARAERAIVQPEIAVRS